VYCIAYDKDSIHVTGESIYACTLIGEVLQQYNTKNLTLSFVALHAL